MYLDGKRETVSLTDLFKSAHLVSGFDEVNVMEEYALYRFITLYATGMYLPTKSRDIKVILSEKSMDMDKFNSYVEYCKEQGASFDLFDERRPFLQAEPNPKYDTDKNIKSVAVLDKRIATGNNPIHFGNKFENEYVFSYGKALLSLLATYLFSTMGGQGYRFGLHKGSPLYFMPKGQNLFETIILSMPILRKDEDGTIEELKEGREFWLNFAPIVPDGKIGNISKLQGMIFPLRRVRLIPEEDGVRSVYFQGGFNVTDNYESYHKGNEYYFTYVVPKKGNNTEKKYIRADSSKQLWRYLENLYDAMRVEKKEDSSTCLIIQQCRNTYENKKLNVLVFGVTQDQANYMTMQRGEIHLDVRIADNKLLFDAVMLRISLMEKYGNWLNATIYKIIRGINPTREKSAVGKIADNIRVPIMQRFYMSCESLLYSYIEELIAKFEKDGESFVDNEEKQVKKDLYKLYLKAVRELEKIVCVSTNDFIVVEKILMEKSPVEGGEKNE